jgi:GT2 family glycosyltransferase
MANYKIGVAIAAHNSEKLLERLLTPLKDSGYLIVLFDDSSSDKTIQTALNIINDIEVINGDGSSWWAGGTAQAVNKCFIMGCDFVLMLNPDSLITVEGINRLVDYTSKDPKLISAGLVVDDADINKLYWGGSKQLNIFNVPLILQKYKFKRNYDVSKINKYPYRTDEVHGRGVLISRSVYDLIGTLDWKTFAHYGADNDYSLRAISAGIKLMIVPDVRVRLLVDNSGMNPLQSRPLSFRRFVSVYLFLTKRKYGDHIRVNYLLSNRYIPILLRVPSFLISLMYIIFKRILVKNL